MFMSNHDAWRWRHRAVAVLFPFFFLPSLQLKTGLREHNQNKPGLLKPTHPWKLLLQRLTVTGTSPASEACSDGYGGFRFPLVPP